MQNMQIRGKKFNKFGKIASFLDKKGQDILAQKNYRHILFIINLEFK